MHPKSWCHFAQATLNHRSSGSVRNKRDTSVTAAVPVPVSAPVPVPAPVAVAVPVAMAEWLCGYVWLIMRSLWQVHAPSK